MSSRDNVSPVILSQRFPCHPERSRRISTTHCVALKDVSTALAAFASLNITKQCARNTHFERHDMAEKTRIRCIQHDCFSEDENSVIMYPFQGTNLDPRHPKRFLNGVNMTDSRVFAIGLMSGTSVDGIDAVLVEISGCGKNTSVKEIEFITVPYPDPVRERLLAIAGGGNGGSVCGSTQEISRMNFLLGKLFADAAETLCEKAGISKDRIAFAGSHGHTIYHEPNPVLYCGYGVSSTLQIGEASMIAERLGCPVVSDFRVRDVAAGGQGAPLVPYTEYLLYSDPEKNVALQNIGGIGNITLIPAGAELEDITAFDTGPGNMVIDALMAHFTGGEKTYDNNGSFAAAGSVNEELLRWLMKNPYFVLRPPKTTGREEYGAAFVAELLAEAEKLELCPEDTVRTATAFTAETIAVALRKFAPCKIDRLIAGGGGSRNQVLLQEISSRTGIQVLTNEDVGRNSDSKEAVAFAVLANERIMGIENTALGATGAEHRVVMGKISI